MIIDKTGNGFRVIQYHRNGKCFSMSFTLDEQRNQRFTANDYDRFLNFENLSRVEMLLMTALFFPVGISMVYQDPMLLDPVVIPEDAAEYEKSGDKQHLTKTHQQNIYGAHFGKNVSSKKSSSPKKPHQRKGGMITLHAGRGGRKESRQIHRKGSFVNGYDLKSVPNGTYLKKKKGIAFKDIFPYL